MDGPFTAIEEFGVFSWCVRRCWCRLCDNSVRIFLDDEFERHKGGDTFLSVGVFSASHRIGMEDAQRNDLISFSLFAFFGSSFFWRWQKSEFSTHWWSFSSYSPLGWHPVWFAESLGDRYCGVKTFLDAFSHLYKSMSGRPSFGHTRVEFLRNGSNMNKIAPGTWNYAILKTI